MAGPSSSTTTRSLSQRARGRGSAGLGVGTFVVPINPRHPLIVFVAGPDRKAASRGNFTLGLGFGRATNPNGRRS